MDADILKALHMVKLADGRFEFRESIELKEERSNTKFCVSEEEALRDFESFLDKFSNITLMAIDEEIIKIVWERTGKIKNVKKFTTFQDLLSQHLPLKVGTELSDFYEEFCPADKIESYSNAEDISGYLKKAFIACIKKSFDFSAKETMRLVNETLDYVENVYDEIIIKEDVGSLDEKMLIMLIEDFVQKRSNFTRPVSELKIQHETRKVVFKMLDFFRPSVSASISGREVRPETIRSESEGEEESQESPRPKRFKTNSDIVASELSHLNDRFALNYQIKSEIAKDRIKILDKEHRQKEIDRIIENSDVEEEIMDSNEHEDKDLPVTDEWKLD